MSNESAAALYRDTGDHAALLALWEQVQRLVARMVGRYRRLAEQNRAMDFDDLMQAGFLGVERAARAYREDAGGFTTVLGFYVKSECAALLGLRGRVRREHYEAVSASTPVSADGGGVIGDLLVDDSLPDEDAGLLRDDVRRHVWESLEGLPVQQASAVRMYHLEERPLQDVATALGVSVERARQIRHKGERTMRKRLQPFVDDALCWRRWSVSTFMQDWTSVTEWAAMKRMQAKEKPERSSPGGGYDSRLYSAAAK